MNADKLLELLFYTLPALITGAVAYNFFKMFTDNENKKRTYSLMRENRKYSLPLRLQAYERMTLFLERIDPAKLLIRVSPISTDKGDYANYVVAQVEQEFEHNLSQQIYLSDECWGYITTAKNATVQLIRKTAASDQVADADGLRHAMLSAAFDKAAPSHAALAYVKNEVKDLI
jgi:hypothetical protein